MTPDELSKLTPEQKRIRIAEACGCVEIGDHGNGLFCKMPRPSDGKLSIFPVPDYLNDLNAMHEAEKSAGFHDAYNHAANARWHEYMGHLTTLAPYGRRALATAAQRADAFLLTLGEPVLPFTPLFAKVGA